MHLDKHKVKIKNKYTFKWNKNDKIKIGDHLCILKLMTIKHPGVSSACILGKASALFGHFFFFFF